MLEFSHMSSVTLQIFIHNSRHHVKWHHTKIGFFRRMLFCTFVLTDECWRLFCGSYVVL